jgi:hypothetical protein
MAPQYPQQRQPTSAKNAAFADSLNRKLAAGGNKAALRSDQARKRALIRTDQTDGKTRQNGSAAPHGLKPSEQIAQHLLVVRHI